MYRAPCPVGKTRSGKTGCDVRRSAGIGDSSCDRTGTLASAMAEERADGQHGHRQKRHALSCGWMRVAPLQEPRRPRHPPDQRDRGTQAGCEDAEPRPNTTSPPLQRYSGFNPERFFQDKPRASRRCAQFPPGGLAVSLLHAPAKPGSAQDHRARFSVTSTDISIEGDQVSLLAFANCSWMKPGSARPRIPCVIPLSSNVLATIQQATRTFMRVPISSHSAAAVQNERSRCSAREKKGSHPGSRRCTRCFYQTTPSLIQRTMAKRRPGREGQDERRKRRPLVTP